MYAIAFVSELIYMMEINFSGMVCRPAEVSADNLGNLSNRFVYPEYVNVLCGTEIRASRLLFYGFKLAIMCFGLVVNIGCQASMATINRHSCILNGQRLPEYLQNTPVQLDISAYCDDDDAHNAASPVNAVANSGAGGGVDLETASLALTVDPDVDGDNDDAADAARAMSRSVRMQRMGVRAHRRASKRDDEDFVVVVDRTADKGYATDDPHDQLREPHIALQTDAVKDDNDTKLHSAHVPRRPARFPLFSSRGNGSRHVIANAPTQAHESARRGMLTSQWKRLQSPGRRLARRSVEAYVRYKYITAVAYLAACVSLYASTYVKREWNDAVFPREFLCKASMHNFNDPRETSMFCHLTSEWQAFTLELIAMVFNILFIVTYFTSIVSTVLYLRNGRNFVNAARYNHMLTPGLIPQGELVDEERRLNQMLHY